MKKIVKAITGVFLTFAAGQSLFSATSHAAPFQVNGQNYDIVAVTATFDGLKPLLEKQVWWNDKDLALDFAKEVRGFFGVPNMNFQGPYFAYTEDSPFASNTFLSATFQDVTSGSDPDGPVDFLPDYPGFKDDLYLFPVATSIAAIPLPGSGVMLLMGLAGVASLRRRRRHAS